MVPARTARRGTRLRRGEKRNEIDEGVGRADETPSRGLGQAQRSHEVLLVLGRHLRDVHLHRAGQDHQTQAGLARVGLHGPRRRLGHLGLGHVKHQKQRLQSQKPKPRDGEQVGCASPCSRRKGSPLSSCALSFSSNSCSPALPFSLLQALKPLFDQHEVREVHLDLEVLGLVERPRRLASGAGKTAHHMAESIHLAHGGQGLLVQPLALATSRRRRNVGKGNLGVGGLLGLVQIRQRVDARVGNLDHAQVGLAAGGAVAGFRGQPGQGIEYGCLSTAGKSDQADLHVGVLARLL